VTWPLGDLAPPEDLVTRAVSESCGGLWVNWPLRGLAPTRALVAVKVLAAIGVAANIVGT